MIIDLEESSPSLRIAAPAVTVVAPDPLLRSGVAAQLRAYAELHLVSATADADVIVVAADIVGGATVPAPLDVVDGAAGVVMVACGLGSQALRVPGLELVCEWVDRAVASPYALGRAVMSAWRCGHRPEDHAQRAPARPAPPGSLAFTRPLSVRELDVLRRIAEGHSTADIADQLSYSESTIKNIVHHVAAALGARNRTHAVVTAMRQGLIEC
jgi:DNA-binding CsgD family transcriptional regulator